MRPVYGDNYMDCFLDWLESTTPEERLAEAAQLHAEQQARRSRQAAGGRVPVGAAELEVMSDTVPGRRYTLRLSGTGEWSCSCPGFVHHGYCKHERRMREK